MTKGRRRAGKSLADRPGGPDAGVLGALLDQVSDPARAGGLVVALVAREVGRIGVRALSDGLKRTRGGITSDDATIFLVEWRGGRTASP